MLRIDSLLATPAIDVFASDSVGAYSGALSVAVLHHGWNRGADRLAGRCWTLDGDLAYVTRDASFDESEC